MASTSSGSFHNSPASTAPSTASESSSMNATSAAAEKPPDDTSKLRMFLGILRKFIGVADIASVRFSLPAQLLEPTPNLEYWNYLDAPSTFVAIGDSDDELDRMLEVLRFWFTKDLKYVKGKPCKPYNSCLGEFFRCNWVVEDNFPPISAGKLISTAGSSAASSIKSAKHTPVPSRAASSATIPKTVNTKSGQPVKVSYLTEQTSHHPPVSAFYVDCPEKGVTARGFDQISAKFTGTSVKITPGEHNLGIFITLQRRDNEQYQLTHPAAHLGGLIRGSLNVTVGDVCYITCPQTKIKTILHYMEEGWLGKTQNKVEGVTFRYDPENDNKIKIKDVPDKDVLARISGNWKEQMHFSLGSKAASAQHLLVDLAPLNVASKILPPLESQLPNESRKYWSGVTEAIHSRQYAHATTLKQELEENQRQKVKQRETAGETWKPRFFTETVTSSGKPELTEAGRKVLDGLHQGKFELTESEVVSA
ncbi:hypothetical protein HYALB_00000341 [Hymenoscyphus albidus]|uniref:Oxysterol-binding protein-like protein 1 n=1 Tax=Hymenoscyphus albidus TaxID=595503 RepID=A0A9N9Q5S6_9HELO|nr:hypothetical protein HYALB_00000341 [Hymenoscyphus albidus]